MDEELRAGLSAGSTQSIDTVRGWISGMIYGGRWRLSDPEAAIQEITLRVLHLARTGRIRDDTDFRSFVMTVTRHQCTDIFRRERLRATVESAEGSLEQRPDQADDPQRALESKERREIVRFIFQALPEECQRLWRWVYGQGMSAADVAERLEITAVNARVRVHRCLKTARDIRKRHFLGIRAPIGAGDGR